MVTDEELKAVYGMFTDAWKLYKRYADIQKTQEARWDMFADEADAVSRKYNGNRLCRDLLLAVTNELERKSNEIPQVPQNAT